MFDKLNDLYQQVILDHSKHPRNFRKLEGANRSAEGKNPMCGDRFSVALKVDGDCISDIGFQGSGCAISKAAASAMTEAVKGKTLPEAKLLVEQYQELVKSGRGDEKQLGALTVFAAINRFPSRTKCAVLPWQALAAAMKDQNNVN